jgi:hypothetical protein
MSYQYPATTTPAPTTASQQVVPVAGGGTSGGMVYDVSQLTPNEQFQVLANMIEADDALNPSPNTNTPPWDEITPADEYTPESEQVANYMLAPDVDANANVDLLSLVSDAYPADIPEWTWDNDPQYYGLGVPPGVDNAGPIESGHTQITVPNPSAELGWDAWSGKHTMARVARHENGFSGYGKDTNPGHMLKIVRDQNPGYASFRAGQSRNLMMAELQQRGLHNIVVADVPGQTYNEQVAVVNPALYAEAPIGPEGVLP